MRKKKSQHNLIETKPQTKHTTFAKLAKTHPDKNYEAHRNNIN